MQDKLQEQFKKLLKSVIWDYHNNNLNQSEVKQEVLDYIFEGKGGDNKFFENYVDFIDQNFIGKEALRIEILKLPKCQTGIYGSGDLLKDILEQLK